MTYVFPHPGRIPSWQPFDSVCDLGAQSFGFDVGHGIQICLEREEDRLRLRKAR